MNYIVTANKVIYFLQNLCFIVDIWKFRREQIADTKGPKKERMDSVHWTPSSKFDRFASSTSCLRNSEDVVDQLMLDLVSVDIIWEVCFKIECSLWENPSLNMNVFRLFSAYQLNLKPEWFNHWVSQTIVSKLVGKIA